MKEISIIALFIISLFLMSCNSQIQDNGDISTGENISNNEEIMQENTNMNSNNGENIINSENNNVYRFTTEGGEDVVVNPIAHATLVLNWAGKTIYVDPAEAVESYAAFSSPDIVLVTHEHGDHFNLEVLEQIITENTELIVNDGVFQKLSPALQEKAIVMKNDDIDEILGFEITSIPAYNLREEALQYHPQGRDNGYLIEQDGFRIYISADTEDTPEMRALTDIDVAFVSINLPYTMPVDSAISGVTAFAPKTVFPYHFKGTDGMSDVERFQSEVEGNNENIDVVLASWY